MLSSSAVSKKSDCTFKYNTKLGRHGWLRLTPAYSVKLVAEVFESELRAGGLVFDPFCGTGTTGIVAAERGEAAILYDINPFLIWFTNLKGSRFSPQDRSDLRVKFEAILESVPNSVSHQNWVPPIFNIARWWDAKTLLVLSGIRATIVEQLGEPHQAGKLGLIWVAFSRLVIETSSAAFNHVSMSFKEKPIEYGEELIVRLFSDIFESVLVSTMIDIPGLVEARYGDSRDLVGLEGVDLVVTSPPYPNRISYIRELRPYMYWLGFLGNAVEAGEIDWDAIGGTWGSATSKLLTWEPRPDNDVRGLSSIVDAIASSGQKNSRLMSLYVHKYFQDMNVHMRNLYSHVNPGGAIHYIVGNSTFFGVHVDSSSLYQEMFRSNGFADVRSNVIRKRNSNKALFEYHILGKKST